MVTKMTLNVIKLERTRIIRSFLCIAMALSAIFSVGAKTLYVSQKTGSNSNNGLSSNTPKATIQNAIDTAASGDTIIVGPGVYADGEGLQNSGHWWGLGRIKITNKALCIKSSDGPAVTHIVGKRGNTTTGYSGEEKTTYGSDVARCIVVFNANTNRPVVIQGFTLRDGSTHDRWGAPSGRGGVLMDSYDGSNSDKSTYIVDCVISNCQGAATQIAVGGTFVRCRIQDNIFVRGSEGPDGKPENSVYVYSGGSRFLNCLFWRNKAIDQEGNTLDYSAYWTPNGRLVNCTIAANRVNFYSHSTAYFYNNIYAVSRMRTDDGSSRVNQVYDNSSTRMMMAPTLGDFRLREGTTAVTAGDAQYIGSSAIIPMPEVDRLELSDDFRIDPYVDLYGNTIPTTGPIACGAVQATAVPAGGALVGYNEQVVFPGMSEANYSGLSAWMWPSNYPTNVKIGIAPWAGNVLHSFTLSSHGTGMSNLRFPLWNEDAAWFIPPPTTNVAMTISFTRTENFKWVDSSNASDTAQDGSSEHPYAVIQDAVNALGANDTGTMGVVLVKPGVYSTGGDNNSFTVGSTVYSRVKLGNRRTRLVSTEGPESTVIVGAADPGSADGCGANAYMTIAMNSQSAVQGFTLTGGYSGTGSYLGDARGSLYSYGRDLHVTDCIITNNVGRYYAIGTARFERCLITGNTGGSGLSFAGMFISCLVGGNTITGDAGYVFDDNWQDHPAYLLNTTAVCDGQHNAFGMLSVNSRRLNSIVCRGSRMTRPSDTYQYGTTAGCLYCGFDEYTGSGYTVDDPMLRGAASPAMSESDFSLYSLSPAYSVGVAPSEDPTGIWWYLCTMDYHGNPWKFDGNGRPVVGASQDTFSGGAYVGGYNGGVSVEGGAVGYNDLATGESLTVGIMRGGSRPIAGFVVNGETNLFVAGGSTAVTVTKADGVDIAVEPIMTSSWYVDAVNGDDIANTGYHAGSAFKTLAYALTNVFLSSGDKVRALPGVYDKGEMYQSETVLLPSRAVVPEGVTLESTDGAEVTVIKGRLADIEIVPSSASYAGWAAGKGMGTNAMRCVYLNSGAKVRGFTLADGRTRGFLPDGGNDHYSVDTCGAGVRGSGTAEYCIFTNCVAFRGGGTHGTPCVNCVFDGNVAMYGGGATSDAYHYGCISRNNVCTGNSNWKGFFYWRKVEECTVMDSFGGPSSLAYVLKNTLILGKIGNWDFTPGPTNFVNCAVATDAGGFNALTSYGGTLAQGVGCIAEPGSAFAMDGWRPVIGANPAVDAGNAEESTRLEETDLSGGQRIYNGAIDIGAMEADWRGIYAADVGGSTMTVQSATENVVESAAHTVCVHPGQSLSATWAGRTGRTTRFELPLRVTGSGTLAVTINGETRTYTASDGECIWRFSSAQAVNDVSAAYVGDDGYGELLAGGRRIGIGISFR